MKGIVANLGRTVLLLAFAAFFALPLLSMLDFSTRQRDGSGRTWEFWSLLFTDEEIRTAILASLLLALVTVLGMLVLLLPTMIWVRLRVPWAGRLVEFLCILPLTVPAIVIVVGIKNIYSWVNYLFGDSALTLAFAYVVLVLPYAYRSLDAALAAIDAKTLAEAARSLGAGWFTVIARVIVPNVASGMLSAAFVSVALVLGEYVFSSLLNFETLPVAIAYLGKQNAETSVAASLATILFASVLLVTLGLFSRNQSASSTSLRKGRS